MRAWWGVVAAVVLIGLGYVGDRLVGAAFVEAARTFSMQVAVAAEGVTRVIAVVLMVGLGWLVMAGPRGRLPGAVMLVGGGYFVLVPLNFVLFGDTGVVLPFVTEAYAYATRLMLWAGTLVAVLGLVELAWPISRSAPAQQPRREVAPDTAEVSIQP